VSVGVVIGQGESLAVILPKMIHRKAGR